MAVSTHYGSHQAIFRVGMTKCLGKCFCCWLPWTSTGPYIRVSIENMMYPMLREGLDKMHGPSHEGASPAKLLCQVATLN